MANRALHIPAKWEVWIARLATFLPDKIIIKGRIYYILTIIKTYIMKKRIILGLSSLAVAVVIIPLFSAFEAHVINVTAKIENALAVTTDAIDFGTVFPQEHLRQPLGIRLSDSFMEEDRVDDVEYFIRQKPKCAVTAQNGTVMLDFPTATGHVSLGPDDKVVIDCGPAPLGMPTGAVWGVLPSLCEYISKEEDLRPDNDSSLASFHQPWWFSDHQLIWNDTKGRLAKSDQDIEDIWTIDLAVPCFGGFCAQDWADFVHTVSGSSTLDANLYTQPIANEHKIFGCDLWVEVSEVSTSTTPTIPQTGTITVNKVVIDGGSVTQSNYTLMVGDGTSTSTVSDEVGQSFAPGTYFVTESGPTADGTTFGDDCAVSLDDPLTAIITIGIGESKTCTITNEFDLNTHIE